LNKVAGTAYFDNIGLYEIGPMHTYVPGALVEMYGYGTARTFDRENYYDRFYTELCVGELITDGVTGIVASVDYIGSPYSYVDTNARVYTVFDAYTDSYNLAESFYQALPYVSWMDIVIGDPKCSPYFDLLPDVSILAEDITFSKELPNQGDEIKIRANIENLGGSHIYNFNVSFRIGETFDNSKKIKTILVPFISSGGNQMIEMTWNTSKYNNNRTIWVEVESDYVYREQNETNNIASNNITINAYPFEIELDVSDQDLLRGDSTEFTIDISDNETIESLLNVTFYIKHNTYPDWVLLPELTYQVENWYCNFTSNFSSELGWYSVMVSAKDNNDAELKYEESKVFRIQNNLPILENLEVSKNSMYRTDNLTINFTANDLEDVITKNMLKVNLRYPGSDWYNFDFFIEHISEFGWQILLVSNITFKKGEYDIKVTLEDQDGAIVELELLRAFTIINNLPVIDIVTLGKSSIYRSEFATIYITGYDIETPPSSMVVFLQQRLAVESEPWSNDSLGAVKWDSIENRWEGTFYTNENTLTGNYSFRAQLIDIDSDTSQFLISDTELQVQNNPPKAVISVGIFEASEEEDILFDASNSSDTEDLTISTVYWDFGDGTESTSLKSFHSYSKSGRYNVTLMVTDKNFAMDFTNTSVVILNVPPVADMKIKSSSSILKVGQPIEFNGRDSTDTKSDKSNLTYLWDFDDGNTSELANTTHVYTKPGTYIVRLTVMDDDGKTSTKIRDLTVEQTDIIPEPEDIDDDETTWYMSMGFILLLLVIIVLVIVALAFVFLRRKKNVGETRVKQPVETLEADMIDTPDLGVTGSTLEAGKTVKRKPGGEIVEVQITQKTTRTRRSEQVDGFTIEPDITEIESPKRGKALPRRTKTVVGTETEGESEGEVIYEPEVEVEYVPEVKTVGVSERSVSDSELDIHLPSDQDGDLVRSDFESSSIGDDFVDVDLPEPGSAPQEDIDFVPPKIDLSGIIEPEVQPVQPHQKEIIEAKSRGSGLDFDFKLPDADKKKKKR
jgi:PKD repeat protein